MDVVEHEQDRPARGDVREQRAHELEREVALARAACRGVRRAARGQQAGERPVVRGQPVVGLGGRKCFEEQLERLDPGLERHERVLVAATEQHRAALRVRAPRELGGERRLADPRLAGDEGEAQRARHRLRPRALETRQRRPAALGALGGGQGGGQRGGARRGNGRDPAAAHVLDERARRGRRRDAELGSAGARSSRARRSAPPGGRRRAPAGGSARGAPPPTAARRPGAGAPTRPRRADRRRPGARAASAPSTPASSAACSSRARSAQSPSKPSSSSPRPASAAASRSPSARHRGTPARRPGPSPTGRRAGR